MSTLHPLQKLTGAPLGDCQLHLARLETTARSGWRQFELALLCNGEPFSPALIQGIHSAGGRWVAPWIEVTEYRPQVRSGARAFDLAAQGLDWVLFRHLHDLLPAGGHLMLGCESPVHRESYLALSRGVPPVATPLGHLLFAAGFPRVKFFDLPEGGWEGQKKLWAEKPLTPALAAEWARTTAAELRAFLAGPAAEAVRNNAESALAAAERAAVSPAP